MKTFKKVLVLFTFVLLIGSLTACSSINSIARNFEDAGYSTYEYNFRGGSLLFSDIDAIVDELDITAPVTTAGDDDTTTEATLTTEEQTTLEGEETVVVVTTNPILSVLGFRAHAFSNGSDKVVIVIEFESEERMQEVLDESPTLQALVEGLDPLDYINGNCILIADESYYDEAVEIFQGNYDSEE